MIYSQRNVREPLCLHDYNRDKFIMYDFLDGRTSARVLRFEVKANPNVKAMLRFKDLRH